MPGEHAGKLACPFKTTVNSKGIRKFSVRKMQTTDLMHMAGPIGMYYVESTDIHPRYKKAFNDLLGFLYGVRCRVLWREELYSPSREEYDCMRLYREELTVNEAFKSTYLTITTKTKNDCRPCFSSPINSSNMYPSVSMSNNQPIASSFKISSDLLLKSNYSTHSTRFKIRI